MIRCYITDRRNCRGNLLDNIERVAADGIEMIQIREKDLESRQLAELTRAAVLRTQRFSVKIIVNGRADVAIGAGAHGIHLPSHSIPPLVWKQVWPELTVGISCHTFPDLSGAEGADYAFFSPVFDSPGKADARGLQDLAHAAQMSPVPVLALGGITSQNAETCIHAGAAGIAAVRMFQP